MAAREELRERAREVLRKYQDADKTYDDERADEITDTVCAYLAGCDETVSPEAHTRSVSIDVRGTPRAQGSMTISVVKGRGFGRYTPEVIEWRHRVQHAVTLAIQEQNLEPFTGPVSLQVMFELARPKSHFGTGKNANAIKDSAPRYPIGRPDLDKLTRCIDDAATDAGLWGDDAQVVMIFATKHYAPIPGVIITITELS